MPQQIAIEMDPDVQTLLADIPSATTLSERQLALHYLAAMWDGKGDVFENGPLLGGATRALALGMMYNKNRDPESRLRTYDWFSLVEPLDLPDNVWEILVSKGDLPQVKVDEALRIGSFQHLFTSLHGEQDYWALVDPHVGYLPGHRGQKAVDGAMTFRLPADQKEFGICFIDGCKSWFGTKHWFREMVPHLRPGTDILFQDFGHYTCFWLPMLISTFKESFELVAYVDYTYVWRVKEVPSQAEVDDLFPDEPTDVDEKTYAETFERYAEDSRERGDVWGTMVIQMQCAAAYAYIGEKDKSRRILDDLLMKAHYFPFRDYLKQARVSPAYTPEGRIEL